MRERVQEMEQQLERTKAAIATPAEQKSRAKLEELEQWRALDELREWRASSTLRYVGKSWTMARGKKGTAK